jgi:hypothetical protein
MKDCTSKMEPRQSGIWQTGQMKEKICNGQEHIAQVHIWNSHAKTPRPPRKTLKSLRLTCPAGCDFA